MDFLTFKSFISIPTLIVFYSIGALVMPIFIWLFMLWLSHRYKFIDKMYQTGKSFSWGLLTTKQKLFFTFLFVVTFSFMELFWRLMFEYLIAYMQIRDALINQ